MCRTQTADVFREEAAVYCISPHPESGNIFATASEDGCLHLYDLRCNTGEGNSISSAIRKKLLFKLADD